MSVISHVRIREEHHGGQRCRRAGPKFGRRILGRCAVGGRPPVLRLARGRFRRGIRRGVVRRTGRALSPRRRRAVFHCGRPSSGVRVCRSRPRRAAAGGRRGSRRTRIGGAAAVARGAADRGGDSAQRRDRTGVRRRPVAAGAGGRGVRHHADGGDAVGDAEYLRRRRDADRTRVVAVDPLGTHPLRPSAVAGRIGCGRGLSGEVAHSDRMGGTDAGGGRLRSSRPAATTGLVGRVGAADRRGRTDPAVAAGPRLAAAGDGCGGPRGAAGDQRPDRHAGADRPGDRAAGIAAAGGHVGRAALGTVAALSIRDPDGRDRADRRGRRRAAAVLRGRGLPGPVRRRGRVSGRSRAVPARAGGRCRAPGAGRRDNPGRGAWCYRSPPPG